jgi:hypothetical protein
MAGGKVHVHRARLGEEAREGKRAKNEEAIDEEVGIFLLSFFPFFSFVLFLSLSFS